MKEKQNKATKKVAPASEKKYAGSKSFSNLGIGLALAILAFALYANSIGHGFTVDDPLVISQNGFVQEGISGISKIWTSSYLQGFNGEIDAAYRPISLSQFAIEKALMGGSSISMHFMHVLYFAIAIFLCYLFSLKFFKGETALAILTTLLFIAHPIHTEVVNNLKSRDEIMLLVGIMGMGYYYLKYLDTSKLMPLLLAVGFSVLALFSKESAISYFLILPFLGLYYKQTWIKNIWFSTALFFGVSLIYLAIRTSIVGSYDIEMTYMNNALVGQGGYLARFPDAVALMGKYLLMLLVPYPLSVDYSYNAIPLSGWSSVYPYLSLLAYGYLLFVGVRSFTKKSIYAPLIAWFFVTMVVASNMFVLIGSTFAERFLFVPSFAFCAGLVYLIHTAIPKVSKYVIGVVCIVFAVFTFIRNGHWTNDETLFTRDVQFQENNARVLTFYGKFTFDASKDLEGEAKQNKLQSAADAIEKALAIAPDYMVANHYQGFIAKEMGDTKLAEKSFAKVSEINPDFTAGRLQYAISLSKAGKYEEAVDEYKKLVDAGDRSFTVIYNLAFSHFKLQLYADAEQGFLEAYKLQPDNKAVLSSLVKVYRDGLKDMPKAMRFNNELKVLKEQ